MLEPLVGMEVDDLRDALGPGQPAFRARQIYEALYRGRVRRSGEISTLPAALREELAARYYRGSAGGRSGSTNPPMARGATCCAWTTAARSRRCCMPEGERDTICISSQVGCPVDCKFCMTALLGLERNLTGGRDRRPGAPRRAGQRPAPDGGRLNIVMMGQGEPLLNLANVLKATRILLDPAGLRALAAAHHGFDRGHRSEDRRTGASAGAAEAGHFAQRLHRRDAAGADAHHAQISPEGSAGSVPRLSAAARGKS